MIGRTSKRPQFEHCVASSCRAYDCSVNTELPLDAVLDLHRMLRASHAEAMESILQGNSDTDLTDILTSVKNWKRSEAVNTYNNLLYNPNM